MQDLSVQSVVILWSESLDACIVNIFSEMVRAFAVSLLYEVLIFI